MAGEAHQRRHSRVAQCCMEAKTGSLGASRLRFGYGLGLFGRGTAVVMAVERRGSSFAAAALLLAVVVAQRGEWV